MSGNNLFNFKTALMDGENVEEWSLSDLPSLEKLQTLQKELLEEKRIKEDAVEFATRARKRLIARRAIATEIGKADRELTGYKLVLDDIISQLAKVQRCMDRRTSVPVDLNRLKDARDEVDTLENEFAHLSELVKMAEPSDFFIVKRDWDICLQKLSKAKDALENLEKQLAVA